MSRSRATAKKAGASFERVIADYLAWKLQDDRIDRKVKTGSMDRGDIANVRVGGRRLAIEVKDVARVALAAWVTEAQTEARNDGAVAGVAVFKRRGKSDPAEQYVVLTLGDLVAILNAKESVDAS